MSKAIGSSWEDVQKQLFTPEEITASNMRVELIGAMIKARKERGLSQKELGKLSGIKQPVIARMEKGTTNPNLITVLKVVNALDKTLYINDIK